MQDDKNKEFNYDEYNEKLHLSDVMFSIFTLDEIKIIIQARQNRSKKILYLPKKEQEAAREILNKIEGMFDV